MYLMDYHIHTNRSTDAKSSLDEVCMAAIEKNVKDIAITDHFEPIKKDPDYKIYDAEACMEDIRKAREKYKGFLTIKFGVELGHPHLYPEHSERLIRQYPYDFVIASGHKMPKDIDFSEVDYAGSDLAKHCEKYLANLKELVLWEHYDCVGHFDLVKRYAARQGIQVNLLRFFPEQVDEILKTIIKLNKGIEINTSGLRQNTGGCLPDYDIIKRYKDLGGTFITVGSDAHSSEDVGEDICQGICLTRAAGFDYITVYDQRMPILMPIRKLHEKSQKESA